MKKTEWHIDTAELDRTLVLVPPDSSWGTQLKLLRQAIATNELQVLEAFARQGMQEVIASIPERQEGSPLLVRVLEEMVLMQHLDGEDFPHTSKTPHHERVDGIPPDTLWGKRMKLLRQAIAKNELLVKLAFARQGILEVTNSITQNRKMNPLLDRVLEEIGLLQQVVEGDFYYFHKDPNQAEVV